MSARSVQVSVSQHLAARPQRRRRSLPPSPSVPMSGSVHQRWRERPRCPALRVTPGRRDGVVHAIVGRVRCRRPGASVVEEERAHPRARSHVRIHREQPVDESHGNRLLRATGLSRWHVTFAEPAFGRATIAISILVPCSASSMLSAALRPGQLPGLRALTTPARGTFSAIARWWSACRWLEEVDPEITQAYVGNITSVPHGTPSVRRHGQRSAHPDGAHRARHRAQNLNTPQSVVRQPRASVGALMHCESRDLSRRIVLRIVRCEEEAFTSGISSPWSD